MTKGGYKVVGVGHHPFSKKQEFKGYFDAPVPCLIATDYKAPKTVLEVYVDDLDDSQTEGERKLTQTNVAKYEGKTEFTYASAFAGIGGMTLGLEPVGGKGVIAWEYDPTEKRRQYAQDAHKLLHPEIPIHGDICEANTDELPDFDVFCFTPPCQSFSVAGKRGGFADTRGTLTFEALRIADSKKPKILFMENVKGLVNHDKGTTMGTIIHAINEIGYTVDFTVVNSKFFDVAQNRERVYLIAVRDDLITPEPWNNVKGTTMLPKAKRRYQEEGARTFNFDWPEQTEVRTRLRDFLETQVDEKYYMSEEKTAKLVAQLEEKTDGLLIDMTQAKREGKPRVYEEIAPTLAARDYKEPRMIGEIVELGKLNESRHSSLANSVCSIDGISPTLDTMQGGHREPKIAEIQGLPIREATKQGYTMAAVGDAVGDAVNIQFPNSETRRGRVGKQIANTLEASGINQGVVEREEVRPVLTPERLEKRQNGRRFKDDGEESFTLTSIDRHGVAVGEYPKYRIRKLTPRECLRLQSVPEDVIDKLSAEFSDSRLYKFAGNGLTTNVIQAIGERIVTLLNGK